MSDSVQDCIDRLRHLAQTSTSDYRIAAGQIVSDFNAHASDADREKLKRRLEDAWLVGNNTVVSYLFFAQHLAWLAVLEGALDAA
jgi:hypothetical protein